MVPNGFKMYGFWQTMEQMNQECISVATDLTAITKC